MKQYREQGEGHSHSDKGLKGWCRYVGGWILRGDRGLYILGVLICIMAFVRIHIRVQTTVIGYEIGSLKDQETKLLEERAQLKMKLSEITTQESLQRLAATSSWPEGAPAAAVAVASSKTSSSSSSSPPPAESL